MLPERDLPLRLVDHELYFDFLGPQDEPWLRVLVEEARRFEGRRFCELAERLAEPLPCEAPHFKRRAATRVLARLWGRERVAAVSPPLARARVFRAAAGRDAPAAEILGEAAAALGVDVEALAASLFADLPGERRVRAPAPPPAPAELALRTNLAVAQAVLMRAAQVELDVRGGVRPIVRLAKLHGLLCVAKVAGPGAEPLLELSGPFALFRHTLLYGRALAGLLPHLAWCARFALRARASLRGRLVDVRLDSGAPIFPAAPPAPFDSRLEARFAREIARLAPDWHVLREPEPVRAGGTIVFPDFLLQHRIVPRRRALVEIVGFWTPEYVDKKLALLRAADVQSLVLCIDDERGCGAAEFPPHAAVVRFKRRLDAAAVLRAVEALTADAQEGGR